MCKAFAEMIDKAESTYGVIVICFCCDNDGGSQAGRKQLIVEHPWLFGPPCCAHQVTACSNKPMSKRNNTILQFQLTLGDYFKENGEAASGAEDATDVIGWILNHQHVCVIFDDVQAERNDGVVLAYLVANLTQWTTHFITFSHLLELKAPLCCDCTP